MKKLNITQLIKSVKNVDSFSLPKMNKGTSYLYDAVFRKMSNGNAVFLSELDFDAFTVDDIRTLSDLYDKVIDKNHSEADSIVTTLRGITPMSKATAYV
jgi:uncharacterized protein with WD repeat